MSETVTSVQKRSGWNGCQWQPFHPLLYFVPPRERKGSIPFLRVARAAPAKWALLNEKCTSGMFPNENVRSVNELAEIRIVVPETVVS
jgi:hypothetical protein